MNINEYTDPFEDPKTIAKAHPKYNKYKPALIILGIAIIFFIPAATAMPFAAIFVIILLIVFIILFIRRRRFLSSVFDEINVSGNAPSWWNASNKKYQEMAQKTPRERITQDISHKFTRCLIEIPFDIAILFLGLIFTFGILPVGICMLVFGVVRIVLNIKNARGYYVMNHQDSIQKKEAQKQAKQEAKKKDESMPLKNVDATTKKVNSNNAVTQQAPFSASTQSASNPVAKAVVGATAAYVTGKAAGNALRKTNDKYRERNEKNKQAQDQAYKNQALRNAVRDSQRRQLSNGKEEIRISGKTFYITTKSNGSQTLENKGITIGKYDKISDTTTDNSGKKIGKGNLLENIIYDNI